MKKTNYVLIVLIVAISFVFYSCSQNDDSMSGYDRVVKFQNDYNNRSSSIGTNIHPLKGGAGNAITVWDVIFNAGATNEKIYLTNISTGNPIVATLNCSGYTNASIEFTMLLDGVDNWKILSIKINGATKF